MKTVKTVKTTEAIDCVLATDVFSSNGSLVLPKGVHLTPPLINALVRQTIDTVQVALPDNSPTAGSGDALPDDQAKRMLVTRFDKLFERHPGPKMQELKQCLIRQQTNNMTG